MEGAGDSPWRSESLALESTMKPHPEMIEGPEAWEQLPRSDEVDYHGAEIGATAQPVQTEHAKSKKASQP